MGFQEDTSIILFLALLVPFELNFFIKIIFYIFLTIIFFLIVFYQIREDEKEQKSIKKWRISILISLNIVIVLWALFILNLTIPYLSQNIDIIYWLRLITFIPTIIIALITLKFLFFNQELPKRYPYMLIALSGLLIMGFLILGESSNVVNIPGKFEAIIYSLYEVSFLYFPAMASLLIIWEYERRVESPISPLKRFSELYKRDYYDTKYLGEGGFAWVYSATRSKDGKKIAIKIPKIEKKDYGEIFVKEVSNWDRLKHPNIVEIYKVNIVEIPFIELELCEGSLAEKNQELNNALNIVIDVANGLRYAHSKRIIHGDIKPSNILMKEGVAKISDWGLSQIKFDESVSIHGFTPQYAAPEQLSSRLFGKSDERTDIYQLGCVFYTLITGHPPFGDEITDLYDSKLNKVPTSPSEIRSISKNIEKIIMKCIERRKENRYQNISEILFDLENVNNQEINGISTKSKLDDTTITRDNF